MITTACEGVFKDVVRAREIETLLAGFNGARIAAARGFSSSPNEFRDVMTDLDRVHTILHFIRFITLPLHVSALLKSDLSDSRRHACFIARCSGIGRG